MKILVMKKSTEVERGDVLNPVVHPHDVLQLPDLSPLLGHHHGGSAEVNIHNLENICQNMRQPNHLISNSQYFYQNYLHDKIFLSIETSRNLFK